MNLFQAPLSSRYFCELRSWRTNIQLNTNGSCQSILSINPPVCSSSSTSTNAHASFISSQNNPHREACVLVCTSIEHPKAHCPPKLGIIILILAKENRSNLHCFLFSGFSTCSYISFALSDSVLWCVAF